MVLVRCLTSSWRASDSRRILCWGSQGCCSCCLLFWRQLVLLLLIRFAAAAAVLLLLARLCRHSCICLSTVFLDISSSSDGSIRCAWRCSISKAAILQRGYGIEETRIRLGHFFACQAGMKFNSFWRTCVHVALSCVLLMDGLVLCTYVKKDLKLFWRIEAELASRHTLDSFAFNYSALPR